MKNPQPVVPELYRQLARHRKRRRSGGTLVG
jgi:hypothetical protein